MEQRFSGAGTARESWEDHRSCQRHAGGYSRNELVMSGQIRTNPRKYAYAVFLDLFC